MNRNNSQARSLNRKNPSTRRRNNRSNPDQRQYSGILTNNINRNVNRNPTIAAYIPPFPDTFRTTLRYAENISLTGAAAVAQTFRATSIYDPNQTGAGAQPLWYDAFASIYKKYHVKSSRIFVTIINNGTSNIQTSVFPSVDASFAGAMVDRLQQPKASYGILQANTGGNAATFLSTHENTAHMYGTRDSQDDPDLAALFGANPAIGWYFLLAAQTFSGAVVDATAICTIDYDVILSERIAEYDA